MAQTTYEDPVHVIELTPEFLKNYDLDIPTVATAGLSAVQVTLLVREMGAMGRAVVKEYRGKEYLLLTGRAGLRVNLRGHDTVRCIRRCSRTASGWRVRLYQQPK